MIFGQMHDGMQGPMQRSSMLRGAAEVLSERLLPVLCHMDGMLHQFVHSLVLHGADGYDRDAQHAFHGIDAERTSVSLHLVHHV